MDAPAPWRPPNPLPGPLRSARLLLRYFVPEDAAALHAAVAASRPTLVPWVPWAQTGHRSVEESLATIDTFTRQRTFVEASDFAMGVFDAAGGELLGGVGLHRIEPELAQGEIGYWIRSDRRDKGFATEAAARLLSSAFADWGLRRVILVLAGENLASRRVAEHLGLRREAVAPEGDWNPVLGWYERWTYGVLAREWDAEHHRLRPAGEARRTSKGFGAVDPRIPPYVERLLEPEDAVLREIRERSVAAGLPAIAVGPFDGRHLEVLARLAGARRIVEIGTLGGYSGTCLARALPEGGVLHTLEIHPRHAEVAAESFRRAGVADRVRLHVGPAAEGLRRLEAEGPFDLVFVDADKASYPAYLAWAAEHLRVGGAVLGDNVFRRAAFPVPGEDPAPAAGIRGFNEALARSGRFRATLLPLEDGLAVGVKVR